MKAKDVLSRDALCRLMFEEKLTQKEIAIRYNVSRASVQRLQKKFGLVVLSDYERRYPKQISKVQKEVLLGSILGDDCIYPFESANYCRLLCCHSLSQKEYIQMKFEIWKNFCHSERVTFTNRKDGPRYIFSTGGHPDFDEIHRLVYVGKSKTITRAHLEQLTPISLAFWFQDDGSRCKNQGLALHTNCFRFDEVQLICDWFWSSLQVYCKPQKRAENQYVVFFSNKTSKKFAQIIIPWTHPCMRYKFEGLFTDDPQRLYAVPFLSTDLVCQSEDKV